MGARTKCSGETFDSYERLIAVCNSGDTDINKSLVQRRHFVVFREYSDSYIAEEEQAKRNQIGMWYGEFQCP